MCGCGCRCGWGVGMGVGVCSLNSHHSQSLRRMFDLQEFEACQVQLCVFCLGAWCRYVCVCLTGVEVAGMFRPKCSDHKCLDHKCPMFRPKNV